MPNYVTNRDVLGFETESEFYFIGSYSSNLTYDGTKPYFITFVDKQLGTGVWEDDEAFFGIIKGTSHGEFIFGVSDASYCITCVVACVVV